jgi:hypothetical protein
MAEPGKDLHTQATTECWARGGTVQTGNVGRVCGVSAVPVLGPLRQSRKRVRVFYETRFI